MTESGLGEEETNVVPMLLVFEFVVTLEVGGPYPEDGLTVQAQHLSF